MSLNIETKIESAIKTALRAGGIEESIRCYWLDDSADVDDPATRPDESVEEIQEFPAIVVVCHPHIPIGQGSAIEECSVDLMCMSISGVDDDPNGAVVRDLYSRVRPIATGDIVMAELRHISTVVEDSFVDVGSPDDETNVIGLSLLISVQT